MRFELAAPAKIIFGQGTIAEIGSLTADLSASALVVTNQIDKAGLTLPDLLAEHEIDVISLLANAGVSVSIFALAGEPTTELVKQGSMSAEEYDEAVRDIVTYLSWLGEPMQQERKRLGIWVLLFLAVFTVLAYFLKKNYWKDVH